MIINIHNIPKSTNGVVISPAVLYVGAVVTVLFFFTTTPSAFAQESQETGAYEDAALGVRAEVIGTTLAPVVVQPLRFGDIYLSSNHVAVKKESPMVGEIRVTGAPSASVLVSYSLSPNGHIRRQSQNARGHMNLQVMLFGNTANDQFSSSVVPDGSVVTLADDGRYYFYIGGTLDIGGEKQNPPGDYHGLMTMILSYQ